MTTRREIAVLRGQLTRAKKAWAQQAALVSKKSGDLFKLEGELEFFQRAARQNREDMRTREGAHARDMAALKNSRADVERVVAWMAEPTRKPAPLAFTEGPERLIAYAVEDLLRREKEGGLVWQDVVDPGELDALQASAKRIQDAAGQIELHHRIVNTFAVSLAMRCGQRAQAQKKEAPCALVKSPSK